MTNFRINPSIAYRLHMDITSGKHLERFLIERPLLASTVAATILVIVEFRFRQSNHLRNFTVECHHEISRDACRWCIYLEVVLAEYGSH